VRDENERCTFSRSFSFSVLRRRDFLRLPSVFRNELNNSERETVAQARARYRRFYYRWGHLLGWLCLPLFFLMLVPVLKPSQTWMFGAAVLLMMQWYSVRSTRIIGKLADVTAEDAMIDQASVLSNRRGLRIVIALRAYLVLLPVAMIIAILSTPRPVTVKNFLGEVINAEILISWVVGIVAMCGAYIVFAITRDNKLFAFLMTLGLNVVVWTILGVILAGIVMGWV